MLSPPICVTSILFKEGAKRESGSKSYPSAFTPEKIKLITLRNREGEKKTDSGDPYRQKFQSGHLSGIC